MILALDDDFHTSCGTQLQERKCSYIVIYFDDDDVNGKIILVIIGSTGSISRSFTKYLSNRSGKHEIKEVQKKSQTAILDITHVRNSESTNVKAQNVCNI